MQLFVAAVTTDVVTCAPMRASTLPVRIDERIVRRVRRLSRTTGRTCTSIANAAVDAYLVKLADEIERPRNGRAVA